MAIEQKKFSLFAANTQNSGIEVIELILENGLTVYLNEDHNSSEIFGAVAIKVGAKNDPSDASGMAHYQEHMLFKGTTQLGTTNWQDEKPFIHSIIENFENLNNAKNLKEQERITQSINDISIKASEFEITNEFNNILRKIGAYNINAYTSFENTVYYNVFPANQIEKWLEIYSHRFTEPVFRSFQAEMQVVLEEKSMSKDSNSSRIMREYDRRFFKVHPYGQSSILGSTKHLKNPSLKKMYDFFKTYYVANNMVLCLSGNFTSQDLIPYIEKTFGKLKSGNIPKQIQYIEKPFKGREFASVRMSPIRFAMLGFRIPNTNHDDEHIFDVLSGILSNENETGLFDKLKLDNKVLNVEIAYYNYLDYGQATLYVTPKILKQSLRNAENLVLKEIEKLKKGDFPDWLVDAVKFEAYRSYIVSLEHIENKGMLLAESFTDNRSAVEIENIPDKIMKVTKDDIVRVANTYFGKDYLAFYSRVGFPNKKQKKSNKINAITSNSTNTSLFAKKIDEIPTVELKENFIDFEKAINKSTIGKSKFYYTKNPSNDIFDLTIYYGVGTDKIKLLDYAASIMNYAGTEDLTLEELKQEFDKIGCTYEIDVSESYLTIFLEGIESNLEQALTLLSQLLENPVLDEEQLDILYEDLKAAKKVEGKKPSDVFHALSNYVLHKDKSPYIDRFKYSEIKSIETNEFEEIFLEALEYESEFYFTGITPQKQVEELISRLFISQTEPIKSESPIKENYEVYHENTVYFTDFKKTNQTRIQFYIDLKEKVIDEIPTIDSFNRYFGGGFTGILLQEIREKRSLAYSADAYVSVPFRIDDRVNFFGSIETQGEKTIEAIQAFLSLINDMPKEPEKMDTIKSYLVNSALTSSVHFRSLSQTIDTWQRKGYKEDPSKIFLPKYKEMTFEQIYEFYEKYIKNKPIVISILGSSKHISPKQLKQFGKLIIKSRRSLYKIKRLKKD